MKNKYWLLVCTLLVVSCQLSAQCLLSPPFLKSWGAYEKSKGTLIGGFSSYDSLSLVKKLACIESAIACASSVRSEYDFITLHASLLCEEAELTIENNPASEEDGLVVQKDLVDKVNATADEYRRIIHAHYFYVMALDFYKKSTIINTEYDSVLGEISVVHKSKKLGEYSPAEIYWILFFSQKYDRISATDEEKVVAAEKLKATGLMVFIDTRNKLADK